jgi:quercetin dioxygenase-like cupin family protein
MLVDAEPEVLVCRDLDRAIALFEGLGLRLETIFPADAPAVAVLRGGGAHVRLVREGASDAPVVVTPRPAFSLVRAGDTPWHVGRAGMQYRDLIPDRQGGRVIASHIRIPVGGPVPDYVHHHDIELQLIYCYRGWVRLVYEDQGEPFVMAAGGCVLQPPGIRHRVLEASDGLEVVELGVPAVHPTHVDHERALPTPGHAPDRRYGGQRFVRFAAEAARFAPGPLAGLEAAEVGIAAATDGIAAVRVLRATGAVDGAYRHAGELVFGFVLTGGVTLDGHRLGPADAFVIPAARPFALEAGTPDLSLLTVAMPGDLAFERR